MTDVRKVRTVGAIVILPLAIGLTTWLAIQGFADELPDPVATHWGLGAEPDGFSSRPMGILLPTLLGPAVGIVVGLVLWAVLHRAPQARRGAGAMAAGLAGLVGGVGVCTLWIQRGLADAHQARDSGWTLGAALGAGLVMALIGAWLMPGEVPGAATASASVPAGAPRLPMAADERAAWTGWAKSPVLLVLAVVSAAIPLVVLSVLGEAMGAIALVLIFAAVLLLTMSTFRVTVGEGGLLVRSVVGWPRFQVPLDQVAEAEAVRVAPFKEFGGWGIRASRDGRYGVVLRKGQALEVRRGDDSRFVVTVDRAAEAAALLNTLADRSRANAG